MVGDLRSEFVKLLDNREDALNKRFQDSNKALFTSIGALEGNLSNKEEMELLRQDLEALIKDR